MELVVGIAIITIGLSAALLTYVACDKRSGPLHSNWNGFWPARKTWPTKDQLHTNI